MKVVPIPYADPLWVEFVESQPEAGPFHLADWMSVICDCYHFEGFVLAVRDTAGEIVAGAPVVTVRSPLGRARWVSLPYSDSCPLLVRSDADTEAVVSALRDHVLESDVQGLEIRTGVPAAENVWPEQVGYNHAVELPADPAGLKPNKGHRYSRNRAIRLGVEVTRGTAAEDVAAFYHLHTLTRRRHGVPVQPRRFFDLIWERMIEPGHGFVAKATRDGVLLAAAVYLHHNRILTAKYHASDPAQPDAGAGYLVDWQTMVDACNEGYRTLDMGRSDFDADGLRLYKSSWGAVEQPLVYTYMSRTPRGSSRPTLGELPHRIIRSSPLWVCRGLGEVFYRWSA
jgi:CelD/BcsL family acetyltransferase involved in cellulose biosynthesis